MRALMEAIQWLVVRMNSSSGETIDAAYFCGAIDMLSEVHGISVSVIRASYLAAGGRPV